MFNHIKSLTYLKLKLIRNSEKKKEGQSNSILFPQKYENTISISSLFFWKSIKIFAKEEKRKKRTEQPQKRRVLRQQIMSFS